MDISNRCSVPKRKRAHRGFWIRSPSRHMWHVQLACGRIGMHKWERAFADSCVGDCVNYVFKKKTQTKHLSQYQLWQNWLQKEAVALQEKNYLAITTHLLAWRSASIYCWVYIWWSPIGSSEFNFWNNEFGDLRRILIVFLKHQTNGYALLNQNTFLALVGLLVKRGRTMPRKGYEPRTHNGKSYTFQKNFVIGVSDLKQK